MGETVYDKGDPARLTVTFTVAGVATDATTVTATVRKPDGTTTAYSGGQIVHDGPGAYHVDVAALDQAGGWTYKFVATGTVVDTETGAFYVLPDPTAPHGRDLCLLADVVARVPGYDVGDDANTDAILTALVTQESRDWLETTRREITPISPDPGTRAFEIDWVVVEERELLIGDAAAITTVELKLQDGTVVQTLAPSSWVELERVREDWEPITSLAFPRGVAEPAQLQGAAIAAVTGSWGFPAIPDTVVRSVATLVLVRYLNDVASTGTKLSVAAMRDEFNLAGSLKVALATRDRLTIPSVG